MAKKSQPIVRKRRAQRYQSSKVIRSRELVILEDQFRMAKLLVQDRPASSEEGKEIVQLGRRIQKMRRKEGLSDLWDTGVNEDDADTTDQHDISSVSTG